MSRVSPTKAFAHLDRLLVWQEGGKPSPVTVEWDLSNACSLACQDCHFAHTHVRGPWAGRARALPRGYQDTGHLADLALVRRGLREARQAGLEAVVWSGGGEPTLHPHWPEIVAYAASLGLRQGMYTLGGHLDSDAAWFLAKTLDWVVVSLDAASAESYAAEKAVAPQRWEAATQGVRRLTGGTAVVGVSFLLHAANWRKAPAMWWLASALGADYTTFRPTIETAPDQPGVPLRDRDWVTEALPLLRRLAAEPDIECDPERFLQYRDWTGHGYTACHGIKLATVVTPDGRLWVCPQRRGVEGSCIGDLRTESWQEAWARHPGAWTDMSGCRVMCRMHLVNQQLAPVFMQHVDRAFV